MNSFQISERVRGAVFSNPAEMAEAFASEVVRRGQEAIAQRGSFTLALTGGRTPEPLYAALGAPDRRDALDWSRVEVFYGDERAVGPDHPDSNYGMSRRAWLQNGPVPHASVHRMEGEAADLDAAASRYEELLRARLPKNETGDPAFDLLLLGMGDDGHVSSLFPGTQALQENERLVVANEVPQLGTHRLTLTFRTINASREIWMLVTGKNKAGRVAQIFKAGQESPIPAQRVAPAAGSVIWWLDEAAAATLAP